MVEFNKVSSGQLFDRFEGRDRVYLLVERHRVESDRRKFETI